MTRIIMTNVPGPDEIQHIVGHCPSSEPDEIQQSSTMEPDEIGPIDCDCPRCGMVGRMFGPPESSGPGDERIPFYCENCGHEWLASF